MKILGFILVTVSSAICGLCYSAIKSDHVHELKSFCLMLEMMQGEIGDKLCPLPVLTRSLSEKLEGNAGSFLSLLSLNLSFLGEKDFDTLWCESLKACKPELNEKELEALLSLGGVLGRYNVETQTKAINETFSFLHDELNKESLELPQLKRLYLGVSMSAGAVLAILLV